MQAGGESVTTVSQLTEQRDLLIKERHEWEREVFRWGRLLPTRSAFEKREDAREHIRYLTEKLAEFDGPEVVS
jgi:hypothetical protein